MILHFEGKMVIRTSVYAGHSSLSRSTYQNINCSVVFVTLLATNVYKENRVYLSTMLKFLKRIPLQQEYLYLVHLGAWDILVHATRQSHKDTEDNSWSKIFLSCFLSAVIWQSDSCRWAVAFRYLLEEAVTQLNMQKVVNWKVSVFHRHSTDCSQPCDWSV